MTRLSFVAVSALASRDCIRLPFREPDRDCCCCCCGCCCDRPRDDPSPWERKLPPLHAVAVQPRLFGLGWTRGPCLILALGSVAVLVGIMVLAVGFHLMRGEAKELPGPVLLGAIALFVAWGRSRREPIAPRAAATVTL